MATSSPHPGSRAVTTLPLAEHRLTTRFGSWLAARVGHEESDLPARAAVAASCLAAAWCLGDLYSATGFLGLFSYRVVRVLLYGAPFLFGSIIAAGFWSRSRAARFLAITATASVAITAFVYQLDPPGSVTLALKVGSGIALLGGALVWFVRAVSRRLLRRPFGAPPD